VCEGKRTKEPSMAAGKKAKVIQQVKKDEVVATVGGG
jgi:hypothetical protein